MISERISRESETEAIRTALIEGERSDISAATVDEIWRRAERTHKNDEKPRRM